MSVPIGLRLQTKWNRWKGTWRTIARQGRLGSKPRVEGLERRELLASATEFKVPTALAFVNQIVEGPDGNMWFTEASATASAIGKITRRNSVKPDMPQALAASTCPCGTAASAPRKISDV